MPSHTSQINTILDIFARNGVTIRHAHFGGSGGGFCVVKGERTLVIDLDADDRTRLEVCVDALKCAVDVERVFLPPAIRAIVNDE